MSDRRVRFSAARTAYRAGNFEQALGLYRSLAEEGDSEAQVFLAWMLTQGVTCPVNESEATSLYARASALGNPIGSFYYGRWLTKSGDHAGAYRMYLSAAQVKYLPAVFRVGYSLVRGKGVAVDFDRGYRLLMDAALRGHIFALREIAVQNWSGARGPLLRVSSLVLFPMAVMAGLLIGAINRYSDRLRG